MSDPDGSGAPTYSSLERARDEMGAVLRVDELPGGLVELTAHLPHLAATARAGEFAQLRCGPGPVPLLRRPFSVAWIDGEHCSFVFERVGAGTRLLADMRPGDMLDSLGPLGIGFTVQPSMRHVVCVAGGLGCAPFPLLARQARDMGAAHITVLHGAATAARLYPAERFTRGDTDGVTVIESTDDGSRGHHGLVVDLIADALRDGADAVFACGPNPMLAATAARLGDAAPAICEASLEAPMGCGFGTCLGCTLPVRRNGGTAWALCCREGPVMPMHTVDWDGLRALPPAHVA
ncbi:MAG TPA: dihydroorotate dehydrogenase electron transfer subunit [Candidatus Angelobacter sp.]|nr:dihydroorotate dehydrogenase electron transfer subunit [Candidatus Angelobacter sp.]